ncbi:unnamed protein product [Victoria cruziana]
MPQKKKRMPPSIAIVTKEYAAFTTAHGLPHN